MTVKCMTFILFFAIAVPEVTWSARPPAYTRTLETELRNSLYSDYEVLQRPSKMVITKVALNLLSIRYLDIKEQNLAVSAYFTFEWIDDRLRWIHLSNYSNIPFIFSDERSTWRPAIIVENSVDDIDVISKPNVLLRIISTGRVQWTPGGVFVTYCESDVTYYPLDAQTCNIIISTWSYTANEIYLAIWEEGFMMDKFQAHGEWEVIGVSNTTLTTKREKESFSRIQFTLRLRRRLLFHILNTIFPVILMAALIVMVFKLPIESGERVGLSLTVLLAYAVYLTVISDEIPQTSISASLLSAYLAMILTLSAVSVILTILILDIYFTPEEKPVPSWLQKLTKHALARIVCWERPKTEPEARSPSPFFTRASRVGPEPIGTTVVSHPEPAKDPDVIKNPPSFGGCNSAWDQFEDDVISFKSDVVEKTKTNSKEDDYSWKEIAMVIDKLFLGSFFVLVVGTTVAFMAVLVNHYQTVY